MRISFRTLANAAMLGVGILLSPAVRVVQAQTASTTITVRLPVKDVMFLELTSSPTITIPSPNSATYDGTNLPVTAASSLRVQSNKAWKVTLSAATTNFGFTNTAGNSFPNPGKPASDVSWGTTNFASLGNLGTSGSLPFLSGATGSASNHSPTAQALTSIYFRSSWLYSRDVPGTYTIAINLTLSTP